VYMMPPASKRAVKGVSVKNLARRKETYSKGVT
jgi:hypothetical protein